MTLVNPNHRSRSASIAACEISSANSRVGWSAVSVGARWEPIDGTSVEVARSSREMNLDKHYPTYYALRDPVLYLNLRWNVR